MGRATIVVLILLGAGMALTVPATADSTCSFAAGDEQRGVQTCDGQGLQARLWANGQTVGIATVTDDYPGLYACETAVGGNCVAAYVVSDRDQQWACASPLVSICLLRDRDGPDSCYSLWFMGVPLPLDRSCIGTATSAWRGAASALGA